MTEINSHNQCYYIISFRILVNMRTHVNRPAVWHLSLRDHLTQAVTNSIGVHLRHLSLKKENL